MKKILYSIFIILFISTLVHADDYIDVSSAGGSGSGTPSGSDTQVQYNDSGAFGGDTGLTYNKTTKTLSTNTVNISGAYTLPTYHPTAGQNRLALWADYNGNCSWNSVTLSGGGGATSPGGIDKQVQFNDATAFGGDPGLTYNKTTKLLSASYLSSTSVTSNTVSTNTATVSNLYADTSIGTSGTVTSNTVSANSINIAGKFSLGQTGNIPVSQLNSGTGATSSTFWRGDATWATPASSSSSGLDNLSGYSTSKILQVGGIGASGVVSASTVTGNVVSANTAFLSVINSDFIRSSTISANSVSFNTIGPISTNSVIVGGAWKLPTWDGANDGLRRALWTDGKGSVSWNTVSTTSGGSSASTDAEAVFNFNGGSSAIVTGTTAFVRMPYNATITGWEITTHANLALSPLFGVSMQTVTYSNWDTMSSLHSIVNPPQINGVIKNTSTNLSGWTTSLTKGDYVQATVVSCNSVTQSSVVLTLTKT